MLDSFFFSTVGLFSVFNCRFFLVPIDFGQTTLTTGVPRKFRPLYFFLFASSRGFFVASGNEEVPEHPGRLGSLTGHG